MHPDADAPLRSWYRLVARTSYRSFDELRRTFPSAELVGEIVVFNIGGNKYRLIVAMHFYRQEAYVRHVLTHAEYDLRAAVLLLLRNAAEIVEGAKAFPQLAAATPVIDDLGKTPVHRAPVPEPGVGATAGGLGK